jgi:ATP-dependent helicase HrpB
VLSAAPGAGKTTRVPRALLEAGFAETGEILVLEPRRLATRLAAARVAEEMGEKAGRTVGYTIRFENVDSRDTRIRFITEAILARRMVRDPELRGVSAVLLDEFHERHLATDLALALVRRLQESGRSDLRLIVMSATIETGAISAYLGGAPIVSSEATSHLTTIEYEAKASEPPLSDRVRQSFSNLLRRGLDGDILVFLPGAAEIRQAAEALAPVAARLNLMITPLHGDLSQVEQLRAVQEQDRRKVILSTNVAESSITIPGVAAVIDSGLARVAGHSSWTGLPTTSIKRISKASARQRAGRAARTGAGHVVRLYSRSDYESRPEYDLPEIKRADLSETVLTLLGAGVRDPGSFPWFEPPQSSALQAAQDLLKRLGAIETDGALTATGRRMLAFPVHPRQSRLIVEGEKQGLAADACLAAALLSERDIRLESRSELGGRRTEPLPNAGSTSDLLEILDRFREAEHHGFDARRLLAAGLDPGATLRVDRARRQLEKAARRSSRRGTPEYDEQDMLRIATLLAFPDRVAKRRAPGSRDFMLASGGEAQISPASSVSSAGLLVAIDAEERSQRSARRAGTVIRLASGIEAEWLAVLLPNAVVESVSLVWNEAAGRVEQVRRTCYDKLVLEERTSPAPPSDESTEMLASAALSRGGAWFRDSDSVQALKARLDLLAGSLPGESLPQLGEIEIRNAVRLICRGKLSLEEIRRISLADTLLDLLPARQKELLRREAPDRVRLRSGRSVKIHYEAGRPPWIESRLQDFFGMTETPAICSGRVPLVAHLLAPNGRAVQVTRDLGGFWQRHYPALRRELQRRYPRHAWPEV